jgi:general secretion pathway protein D
MTSSRCYPAGISRPGRISHGLLHGLTLTLMVGLLTTLTAAAQENLPPGFRAMELRAAAANDVAPRMQQILREADPTAEVLVDARRNQLLIRGTEATQRLALDLVQTLDRRPAPGNGESAPNQADATVVRGYAVPREQIGQVTDDLRARFPVTSGVRIAADERTSQLVVVAPPAVQQEIERQLTSPAGQASGQAAANTGPARSANAATTESTLRLQNIAPQVVEQYLRDTWGQAVSFGQDETGRVVVAQVPNADGSMTTLRIDRSNGQIRVQAPGNLQDSWRQLVSTLDSPAPPAEATRLQSVRQADPARVRYAVGLLRTAGQEQERDSVTARPVAQLQPEQDPLQDEFPDDPEVDPDTDPDAEPPIEEVEQPADGGGLLGDVRIEFIPELGVFIIRGRRADVERVQRIIAEIEAQSTAVQPEIEVVPLRHVNSQALATLVVQLYDNVFAPRQGPLSITALDKPNALLLIGRQETMTVVKELITKLDEPVSPATQLRVFHLKHVSATDAERLVRGFFVNQPGTQEELRPGLGTRARVLAEYRTNALIVQAARRDMAEVAHFINSIDIEGPESQHEIRIIQLANTMAQDLAPILQGAITGAPVPGQQQQQVAPGGQQQTTPQSARLLIRGLDVAANRIIESGALTDVTVTADPNTNSLVIRGPGHTMDLMVELINQLDRAPSAASQIKVFHLENGDATNLTAMLQLLFGQTVTAGQGNLGQTLRQAFGDFSGLGEGESSLVPLRFAVDVRTNSIIASGNAGDLEVVEILLLRLDESGVETRKMFVRRLKNAPAQDVANSIQTFLNQQRQLVQQQLLFNQAVSPFEQIDREVIVVPEFVTNSLIVSVTPRLEGVIMKIIDDLDFRPPMVMVSVMICEVALTDDFEFGIELGLQDSLLFDRSLAVGGANIPGFNFNNSPLGNSNSAASLATRGNLAGQGLSSFNLGRTSETAGYGGLVLSAANESVSILVRALQDAGRLQILSRPQVMALDNQVAFVQVGARVPRITGATVQALGGFQTATEDVDVGLLLRIQPRINEDGLVVMILDAEKSEVGPIADGIPVAVTETGEVINSPQINTTTASTTISAQNGQTVVFAGLITKNRAVRSRRVPFLGDIPILGRLFRYDAESDARTELLIFMTPHIVSEEWETDWLNYVESDRMSWCLGDVIEMHGEVGMSGGHGLWGPPVSPLIFPAIDPTGTEQISPPMKLHHGDFEYVPEYKGESILPAPDMGSARRELPWRTYVEPAPQPQSGPLPSGSQNPLTRNPQEANLYPLSQGALQQFPQLDPSSNYRMGSATGYRPQGMYGPNSPADPRMIAPTSYQTSPMAPAVSKLPAPPGGSWSR